MPSTHQQNVSVKSQFMDTLPGHVHDVDMLRPLKNAQFYARSARMFRRYICILFKDDNKGYI